MYKWSIDYEYMANGRVYKGRQTIYADTRRMAEDLFKHRRPRASILSMTRDKGEICGQGN